MKEIHITAITRDTVASMDYFGRDGKILIRKGVTIDDTLLSAIHRRRITKFYIQEEGEDIKKLLNLQELEHFNLDDGPAYEPSDLPDLSSVAPKKVIIDIRPPDRVLPILLNIKRGEEGVQQILKTQSVQQLETALETNTISLTVAPAGTPVREVAREIEFGNRTQEYKDETVFDYNRAIAETKRLFLLMKNDHPVQAGSFIGLVKSFIKTYLNDKHMLFNLANARSTETDYLYAHSVNVCLISISIAA